MKTSDRLNSLINNERTAGSFQEYSLDNIKALLRIYGNPHKKIRTVHVAGTNGKGSVCHMLSGILAAAGYKTGLYTSPHLLRINERIRINGKSINDAQLNTYIDELFAQLEKHPRIKPTYFDALTLFAFRYFYDNRTDIAIIETGLGGRLDTTNVIAPLVSIITDISYDHKDVLGNTIEEIALEKAGIIKSNTPVVTPNSGKVLQILQARASENKSKLYAFDKDFKSHNTCIADNAVCFDYSFYGNIIDNIVLRQPGAFQQKNASCAITAAILLNDAGFNISAGHIKSALKKIKVPGRFEIISRNPLIIYDPAHNPHALDAVLRLLKQKYPSDKKIIFIVSFMKDKDYKTMFKLLRGTGRVIYYKLNDARALAADSDTSADTCVNSINSLADIIKSNNDALFLFTGTFKLYSITRKIYKKIK